MASEMYFLAGNVDFFNSLIKALKHIYTFLIFIQFFFKSLFKRGAHLKLEGILNSKYYHMLFSCKEWGQSHTCYLWLLLNEIMPEVYQEI